MSDTSAPLMVLTDRSRYTTGTGRCRRERFLRYHWGPTGYGIVRKAESLPLMTGGHAHQALELIYLYLKEHDSFPPAQVIRDSIAAAIQGYETRVEQRGFRGLLASERAEDVVREQGYLITGLVWALCRTILPWIHTNYQIIDTEREALVVLGCTCGLGEDELDVQKHDALQCQGIGQMLRLDAVGRKRSDGKLAYFEAKTTGWSTDAWASQWETKPQLAIGSFGMKARYGAELSESFILGMQKGQRREDEKTGLTRQESPFCYGFRRESNPPLSTEEWLPTYRWTDAAGQTRNASRAHQKTGVWEIANGDWPTWVASTASDPTLTPAEVWVWSLPTSVLDKQVFLIGPLTPQRSQIESLKTQIEGEERAWQEALWQLYQTEREGYAWASPEYQHKLDLLVPASWSCRAFGSKHECEMSALCFKRPGWEDPMSMGIYVPRRPHHIFELDQAVARGLLPAEAEGEEEGEE